MTNGIDASLLGNWILYGLVVEDAGDGAWDWTDAAKDQLDPLVRTLLGTLLYGHELPRYEHARLRKAGFDPLSGRVL